METQKKVAIKIFRETIISEEVNFESFMNEIKILS